VRRRALVWIVPLIGAAIVASVPFVRYVQKRSAESAAAEFVRRVQLAQQSFRSSQQGMGYAASIESLTVPCPGSGSGTPLADAVNSLERIGYTAQLRAAEGATSVAPDCHGRPTVSDYYAAAAPQPAKSAGQQAFAATAGGRIFVFFDGIAPLERDMAASGLATPLDGLSTFKIP